MTIEYDPNKPFYKSKKWWTALIAFAVPVVNYLFGFAIDPNAVWVIISPLLIYLLGQAYVDGKH